MSGGPNITIGESPYRRKVEKTRAEIDNFEICVAKETYVKVGWLRKKKYRYIHLKETEDGLIWNIAEIPPDGPPRNYTLSVDGTDTEE